MKNLIARCENARHETAGHRRYIHQNLQFIHTWDNNKKCTESNSTMHMQSVTTILNHVGLINICCQSLTYTELNSQDLIALIVNTQMAHCIWWLFLCCFICIYTRSTPAFTNLAFLCPAFSEPAVWSVIMSCIFTSCNLVLHLHVLHSYLLHFQHPHFEKLILAVLMLCLI